MHRAELWMVAQHALQPIVGNAARQMMHVMDADVGGEPAENARQLIIRAAMQCGLVQGPCRLIRPVGVLELVLDVEQPDPYRRGQ